MTEVFVLIERILEWFRAHKLSIFQGFAVFVICAALAAACVGCSSFSGSDSAQPQFGLANNNITITGGVDET